MENGELGQIYFGKRIHIKNQYANLIKRERREAMPSWKVDQYDFQPDHLKQEYASLGKGDFREPAYQVQQENGSRITELQYVDYRLQKGKKRLSGLPSSFADESGDVETLAVYLKDALSGLTVTLRYSVFPHQNVIVRSAEFVNKGKEHLVLRRALSCQIDLPDSHYDFIHFAGTWSRERHEVKRSLQPGIQRISSLRTESSHQHNPFIMLARPQTTEDCGDVYGFNFVYSGNFLDQIEVDQYGTSRVLIGINPEEFSWNLASGATFQTPEAILSFSSQGKNKLSQQLGHFYLNHLVNPRFSNADRPILVNNWEATYFNFNEDKLLSIASKAAELGIELFVLDDGWFGHRDDDTTSLGDWFVDRTKLPDGLAHLADKIHGLGLKFGLWFEPEMISLESDLYQEHPDWMIAAPHRTLTPGRNQYVLDFTRDEVVDTIFKMMAKCIEEARLDYIKWDMNRCITEMYSSNLSPSEQLEMPHRYILGVYKLYQRLIDHYPNVLFESCASGGGRFDLGMMYYAPQAWTSDDTDAAERILIQYGTSYGYPLSMMGAHVSAVPNHQTGRVTPFETRGHVAFFGDFGYELDITKLSKEDQKQIRAQVNLYKKYRRLFQYGNFYRLESPYEGEKNVASWEVVNDDQTLAIAARYQLLNRPNPSYLRLYVRGLNPDQLYRVNGSQETFYGDELMNAGYFVDQVLDINKPITGSADFSSRLFIIKAVK
ncbi:alpha-galactosidase [Sporolactobacillus sp. Y61]|uniref:Alpha-galactosidase n=1 Tax=Sporolactobacillus sp. Y61 TaxID=3160863 RepID=A0AAU8IJE0_9BACL